MRTATKIFWMILALTGGFAFAVVTGIFNVAEKVNAVWVVVAAICIYTLAYRFYAAFLSAKVLALDARRTTAAERINDGIDYHPTNRWILFGHHFAAISGAGPLIGPTLAAQFGYLPGFLWILIGATLGGAVHDMVILAASVRRNGHSLARIVKDELGTVGGVAAAFAILFNVVIAVSGAGLAVVNALAKSPWGTFTVALTIPIAMLMGVYLRYLRPGRISEVSVIGALLLFLAVYFGRYVPGSSLEPYFYFSRSQLIFLLGGLCFFSSALPVWLLLVPRDYVSAYIKIGTFLLLLIGIFATAPVLMMPPVTKFAGGGGPIIPGKVFPFLFITIACGAISGFHALISSGTTPKMINRETDIPLVGFGGMLTESIVALLSLIAATILIPGDYFAINTGLGHDALTAIGFAPDMIAGISSSVGADVAGRPGGAVSLAVGMSAILSSIIGGERLMAYWYNFSLMFQALFILTLVDAGTRVGRFILQEIGGHVYKPIREQKGIMNIMVSSFLIVFFWVYLIFTGSISTIWPMFGIANQILAAVAFGLGTTLLIKSGKLKYIWTTLIPMVLMFVIAFTASYQLMNIFLTKAASAATRSEAATLKIDAFLVFVMACLGIVILGDMFSKWYGYLTGTLRITTSEIVEYTESDTGF